LLPAEAFAGWDLHPLESAAFSRRTQRAVIAQGRVQQIKVDPERAFKIVPTNGWEAAESGLWLKA
jgi:hypothetical protein